MDTQDTLRIAQELSDKSRGVLRHLYENDVGLARHRMSEVISGIDQLIAVLKSANQLEDEHGKNQSTSD